MRCLFFGPQEDELANWGGNAHHSINVSDRESMKNMQGALFTAINMSDSDFIKNYTSNYAPCLRNHRYPSDSSNHHAFITKQK
jgi:hypothetical protein